MHQKTQYENRKNVLNDCYMPAALCLVW